MAKAVFYSRAGQKYSGPVHKMPDGSIHTGARHSAKSKPVVRFKDLSAAAKAKARKRGWLD